ncbi:hypothetical protein [Paenibacillus alvei]|uniref:hypothetical protein n=1 Tax=Paenibacillus alvei TaxID=44250 RepID=UPI001C0FC32B|nr:hypothetical protein [Paenibacillus alvei]
MSFTMEVASPEEIQKEIEQEVKPVPEEVAKLEAQADSNVAAIMNLDLNSLENRKDILQSINGFGMNTMRSYSAKNNALLVSISDLSKKGDEGGWQHVGSCQRKRNELYSI